MVDIPEYFQKGYASEIGTHVFTDEDILRYTNKLVPAEIHTNTDGNSTLTVDGVHIACVWMSLQRSHIARVTQILQEARETYPIFGPSPGVDYIKWPNPALAGDAVTYQNHIQEIRASSSRPNWWVMTNKVTAWNQNRVTVMEFQSSVLLTLKNSD